MKKRIASVLLALCIAFTALPVFEMPSEAAGALLTESFENADSLNNWSASQGNTFSISSLYAKHEGNSARWDYTAGGALTYTNSLFAQMAKKNAGGIRIWIYNAEPVDADLTFTIGTAAEVTAGTPRYRFTFHLDYTGWRTLLLKVNVDGGLDRTKSGSPDTMQISMPEGVADGTLYLDLFEIKTNVTFVYTADYQAPYLTNVTNEYRYSQQKPKTYATEITESEISDFDRIEQKLDRYVFPQGIDYASLPSSPLKTRYQKLTSSVKSYISKNFDSKKIQRQPDGRITGAGLFSHDDDFSPKFSGFETTWIALLADYKLNHSESSRDKLLLLFDYFNDQGWAEGSALGTLNHEDNRTDGYAYAVYLMRDELLETGRLERELGTLGWYSISGIMFDYDPQSPDYTFNTDSMRTSALYQLMYILAMPDSAEKTTYMQYYTAFIEDVILPRVGLRGGIKPDGTVSHHNGVYMAGYGSSCTYILSQIAYLLDGTQFELSGEAVDTLKNVLNTYYESACKYSLHYGLRGRFPGRENTLVEILGAYSFFAACGDREMSEKFLYLWDTGYSALSSTFTSWTNKINYTDTLGQLVLFEEVLAQAQTAGYTPQAPSDTTFIKPYGGYLVHRQDNWMLSTKGFSKYVWDYEASASENKLGRYVSYGTTVLFTDDDQSGGIDLENGWDWTRWPSSTTLRLQNEELLSNSSARNFSDQAFLGGAASGNEGVFGMSLHDNTFDPSFRAKKSWFCFGDQIICLGSDIQNTDADSYTQTTLFQTAVNAQGAPLYTSFAEGAAPFPGAYQGQAGESAWLLDTAGNGYLVPDAAGLVVESSTQNSLNSSGKYATSGDYAAAYFNHGYAPGNAGYQYVIVPQTSVQALQERAANPGYTVLQQDSRAHAVRSGETTGYLIFDGTDSSFSFGKLQSVSAPCAVMERKISDTEFNMTVSDPDLRVVDTTQNEVNYETEVIPSQPKTLTLTLNGSWKLRNPQEHITVSRLSGETPTTTVEIVCSDGAQYDLSLVYDDSDTQVSLSEEALTLCVSENATLSAAVTPSHANGRTIEWSSDNEAVVRVDSEGELTAISEGVAVVTATLAETDCRASCRVTVQAPALRITTGGEAVEGDVLYAKLPSIFTSYQKHAVTIGFSLEPEVQVQSVQWSYANWSVENPEANIESPDGMQTIIRPNGRGIGARSVWVTLTVTDVLGNQYSDTVKVRFYKFDWQK